MVGREQHGGGEIVGVTVGHLRHQIGGGGRHYDQVGVAREPDVPDVEFAFRIEQVDERMLARKRADRQRRDELLRRLGHHHPHRRAALAQAADQIE